MNDIVQGNGAGAGAVPGKLVPATAQAARLSPLQEDRYVPAPPGLGETPRSFSDTLNELRRMFIKRKWLMLSIISVAVTFGVLRTMLQIPLYASTVRLQIDRNVVKVVESGGTTPVETNDSEFLRTQYELLLSRSMAERAVSALRLGDNEAFLSSRSGSGLMSKIMQAMGRVPKASASAVERERTAAALVLVGRSVRPVAGSRMVDLTFADTDPQRAQKIATALADVFLASSIDKRFQANAYAKTFLEDQIAQLKVRLETAEKAMIDFAEKEKIVIVNERASVAESNLQAANIALGTLVQDRIKNEGLWKQVEVSNAINLPQFLLNPQIEALRAKRSGLVTDYQQRLETFKPGFPAMVQITNQIADIDRQLTAEVKAIKASLRAAYDASVVQEAQTLKRVDELKAELLDLQKRSIQYNLLKREVDTTRSLYDGLLQRFKEVDIAGGVGANNIFIVDKAEVAGAPFSPVMSQALTISILIGVALALIVAYLLEYLDDAVRSAEAVEGITGLIVLGIIPKAPSSSTVEAELADPSSSVSESYRSLATSLQLSTDRGLPKSVVITSAGPSEGKSNTAIAITRHFAMMGLKVLLVDADMRNPSLHKKLGTSNAIGFSTYLTGGCSPPEAFQATSIPNLAFMASGPLPPNAADLLSSPRLNSLIAVGNEVFDLILLDGPPTMGMADAQILSNVAAATVLVVSAGQTRATLLKGAIKRLYMSRASLIGAVLTKYDARQTGYEYGYGYGYGYGQQGRGVAALQEPAAAEEQPRLTRGGRLV